MGSYGSNGSFFPLNHFKWLITVSWGINSTAWHNAECILKCSTSNHSSLSALKPLIFLCSTTPATQAPFLCVLIHVILDIFLEVIDTSLEFNSQEGADLRQAGKSMHLTYFRLLFPGHIRGTKTEQGKLAFCRDNCHHNCWNYEPLCWELLPIMPSKSLVFYLRASVDWKLEKSLPNRTRTSKPNVSSPLPKAWRYFVHSQKDLHTTGLSLLTFLRDK